MKVLVTGAPGWLGTTLVERLAKDGREIRCFVLKGMDATPLEKLGVHDLVFGDIRSKKSLKGIADGTHTVVHCAGVIHPPKVANFDEINHQGTRNLLEEAVASGVRKFIHISSNSAQGFNVNRQTLMVETGECKPESPYGRSKRAAEIAVMEHQGKNGMQTVILRPCMYFGPGMPNRMVRLINMVKGGRPLVFGDGRHLRSLTYVPRLVDAVMLAEQKDKANGQIFWIADKQPYSTVEIYEALAQILGVKIEPRYLPAFMGKVCEIIDVASSNLGVYLEDFHIVGETIRNVGCDPQKSIDVLGMQPNFGIVEGYKAAIEWAKEVKLI